MRDYPKVSIIIPHYGRRKSLKYLLMSILRSDYPKDMLEIVIVTDNVEYIHEVLRMFRNTPIKVKVLSGRLWYSASNWRNIGGLNAEGDILAFIDDDIVLSRNALRKLVKIIVENPEVGCVRPAIYLFKNGRLRLQTLGIRFYKKLGLMRAIDLKDNSLRELIEVDAGGGVMIVSKEIFIKTMFDEYLPFLYEDLDFILRIKKLGYKIVTVKDAIVIHIKEHNQTNKSSTLGETILKNYFSGRNSVLFNYRHGGVITVVVHFLIDFAQVLAEILRSLAFRHMNTARLKVYHLLGLLQGLSRLKKCRNLN